MGKLFVLIGKSASGKDAVYKQLIGDRELNLQTYVGYTTRPIRSGEQDGREYFFTGLEELKGFEKAGKLIEKRVYHTVHGDWYYYSVDNETVNLDENSFLYIGTLESYLPLRDYYGADRVIPLYIQVEDGLRLERALSRERMQENPKYAELCRRFLKDSEDFSEEKISAAGISVRFNNIDFEQCVSDVRNYIEKVL